MPQNKPRRVYLYVNLYNIQVDDDTHYVHTLFDDFLIIHLVERYFGLDDILHHPNSRGIYNEIIFLWYATLVRNDIGQRRRAQTWNLRAMLILYFFKVVTVFSLVGKFFDQIYNAHKSFNMCLIKCIGGAILPPSC